MRNEDKMKLSRRDWQWILGVLPVVALLFALLPGAAVAATTVGGNDTTIQVGRVIHDDLYIGGQNVNVNGTVTGNLIVGGSNVNMNGHVGGSILAAGGNISVNGTVGGSVIAAGGNLDVAGRVSKDVTMLGGNLHLVQGSTVGRDVLAAAGTATVEGSIARNLKSVGKLNLHSGAAIGGNLTYRGDKPVIPPGVMLHGRLIHETGDVFSWSGSSLPWNQGPWFLGWLRTLVGMLALGLIFVWLAPKYSRRTVTNLETRWRASLGWGLLTLIVTPILALLAFIAGLWIGGWWLGLIALFVYVVAIVLAVTVAGLTAVAWATKRGGQQWPLWAGMVAGVVLVTLVGLVPYVGWAVVMVAMIWALGGLTMTLFQQSSAPPMQLPEVPIAERDGAAPVPRVATPVT